LLYILGVTPGLQGRPKKLKKSVFGQISNIGVLTVLKS